MASVRLVFADLTAEQKAELQINSLQDMQARARKCRALQLCRQAVTASKHWKVTDYPDPNVAVIVTANAIGDTEIRHPPIYVAPSWHLYFVDGSNIQEAEEVFSLVSEFWTHFIYHNGIAA